MENNNPKRVDPQILETFQADQQGVQPFLSASPPFDLLPTETVTELSRLVVVRTLGAEELILKPGELCQKVYVIRSGAVSVSSAEGTLLTHLEQGDTFGATSSSEKVRHPKSIRTDRETVLYQIPQEKFESLCDHFPSFAHHFLPISSNQVRGSLLRDSANRNGLRIIATPLSQLVTRSALVIDEKTSIRKVAEAMDQEKVDNVLLVKGGELTGILTHHDLSSRVVAKGHHVGESVSTVMTPNPATLDASALGVDAAQLMTSLGIEHIPVLDKGQPIGVVTAKNLSQNPTTSAIYLVRETYRRKTLDGLKRIAAQIPNLLADLTDAWIPAHNIGHLVSSVTDALNIRLLQLAEEHLGPPPVSYNWVVVGSLGRCEQTAVSDQDNFMLFDNDYDEAKHGDYFTQLAEHVCTGMNELGYVFCPGGIMAQNIKWRQPLKVWKGYFRKWMEEPEPKALMLSCIFFDLRSLYGKKKLFLKLEKFITERSKENRIYLAHMAANALTSHPPLGFFNNFTLVREGLHKRTLNLKQNGVIPIVDLARIYALSAGADPVNTVDRLKLAAEYNILSREGCQDLLDAFELISITRLRYQARLIRENKKVDNYMSPKLLTNMERDHLKDAFSVTQTMQAALRQHFQTNSLG
ncbi:MAG: cyclic nucleotide-binding/CBS domain-containing protein [Magnetococcales bacterium]|nr:cyclic nucleotide-binding/CBS domain-containing protein [Magnetococcales bacterium]